MMAKVLIIVGVLFVVLGLVWHFFPQAPAWVGSWFGKLPGDIRYEGENTKVYFPIVTMIVLSVVLSIVMSFFNR